jgi:hypothetical protein
VGLGVVLGHGAGFGVETMVFRPVKRNSYLLRVVDGGWRYVVRDASSGVRVVVVVVCFVGADVDIDAMFSGQVIGGWYGAGVGGGLVVVVSGGCIVVCVVVMVVCCL